MVLDDYISLSRDGKENRQIKDKDKIIAFVRGDPMELKYSINILLSLVARVEAKSCGKPLSNTVE